MIKKRDEINWDFALMTSTLGCCEWISFITMTSWQNDRIFNLKSAYQNELKSSLECLAWRAQSSNHQAIDSFKCSVIHSINIISIFSWSDVAHGMMWSTKQKTMRISWEYKILYLRDSIS